MTRLGKSVIGFGVLGLVLLGRPAAGPLPAAAPDPKADRTVYLAGGLAPEQIVSLSANLAASGRPGLLLLDTPRADKWNRKFLGDFQAGPVVPVGEFANPEELAQRLGRQAEPPRPWRRGPNTVG